MQGGGATHGELERRVAQALVAHGVVPAGEAAAGLFRRGQAARVARGGSVVLGAAVREGLLPPAAADALMAEVRGGSGPGGPADATFMASEPDRPRGAPGPGAAPDSDRTFDGEAPPRRAGAEPLPGDQTYMAPELDLPGRLHDSSPAAAGPADATYMEPELDLPGRLHDSSPAAAGPADATYMEPELDLPRRLHDSAAAVRGPAGGDADRTSAGDADRTCAGEAGPGDRTRPDAIPSDQTYMEAEPELPASRLLRSRAPRHDAAADAGAGPAADATVWHDPDGPGGAGAAAVGDGTQADPDAERTVVFEPGDTWADGTPSLGSADTYWPDGTRADGAAGPPAIALARATPEERYEVIRQLDAERWAVLDRRIQRPVLLVRATAGAAPGLFFRPARILAQLDHPVIPRVHDIGVTHGAPFYSQDRLEGEALPTLRSGDGEAAPTTQALVRAFLGVVAAVDHAHAVGLVHTDLRPGVVVLGGFGQTWLTGWERARLLPHARQAVRRAAQGEGPPVSDDGHVAPEVRAGGPPDERSDVFGLGALLHWILLRRLPGRRGPAGLDGARDLPRELVAVTRKALARDPDARYDRADDLAEDVRRYLDGREVEAERDTVLQAAARTVRRHPVASLIGALGLVGALGGGALGYAVVHREYEAAQAKHEEAAVARERAEASRAQAEARLERAERARAVAGRRQAVEERLRSGGIGRAALAALEGDLEEAVAAAGRDVGPAEAEAMEVQLRTAFHRRRGRFHLRNAEPRRALDEYLQLVHYAERSGQRDLLPEAHFGRFLAARRLPGAWAEAEEASALADLARLGGDDPLVEVGRLERIVREIEAEARRLAAERPRPAMIARDDLEDVRARLDALLARRGDLAQAWELSARYGAAVSVPGAHRGQEVRLGGEVAKPRRDWQDAYTGFFNALHLDPVDPVPRTGYIRVWNAKHGLHSLSRWIGAWTFAQALGAAELTPRVEPRLQVIDYLQQNGREEGSLLVLGPVFETLAEEAPRGGDLLARARLYEARGLLVAGLPLELDLAALEVPPELEGERFVLLGWSRLVAGRIGEGFDRLFEGLRAGGGGRNLRDFANALADPRVDPHAVLQLLGGQVPPPGPDDGSPVVQSMLFARAVALSRIGVDPRSDLARLEAAGGERWSFQTALGSRAQLALARFASEQDPRQPWAHAYALLVWSAIDVDTDSTERSCPIARDVVVRRLERLGARDQARAFAGFEPVAELWERRRWVPPEGYAWRVGRR